MCNIAHIEKYHLRVNMWFSMLGWVIYFMHFDLLSNHKSYNTKVINLVHDYIPYKDKWILFSVIILVIISNFIFYTKVCQWCSVYRAGLESDSCQWLSDLCPSLVVTGVEDKQLNWSHFLNRITFWLLVLFLVPVLYYIQLC